MKKTIFILLIPLMMTVVKDVNAQTNAPSGRTKVLVYYFHPDERCPIDQSIEKNTKDLMQSTFAKEIKDGEIIFRIINTDDKANEKLARQYDINTQALYVVKIDKGKEIKTDLTQFAFDYGQSNPPKFTNGLKEEINKALGIRQ